MRENSLNQYDLCADVGGVETTRCIYMTELESFVESTKVVRCFSLSRSGVSPSSLEAQRKTRGEAMKWKHIGLLEHVFSTLMESLFIWAC